MVPGQKLVFDAPAPLVEMLQRETANDGTIGMVGRQRTQLFTHGVEVHPEVLRFAEDGGAKVSLHARRLFE